MDSAPAVVMGEKMYVRRGDTEDVEDRHNVFQYNISRDKWSCHTLWQQINHHHCGGLIPDNDITGNKNSRSAMSYSALIKIRTGPEIKRK